MEILYVILFICYSSYAFNRKSVVFSMTALKEEGLDPSHAGLITSCQNIAFAIGEFLAGILSDSLHPQQLFSAGLVISGTATILFSYSSTITAFCSLWFVNGLAQGCGWPSCAKILRQRAPPSQFGTLWSILSASNNFAGSLGPIISAYILVHYGWRWNVFNAGVLTLLMCGLFMLSLLFLSDAKNPTAPEKKETSTKEKTEDTSLKDLFLDPCIWMLSISLMVVFCARTTTLDWGQMYLMEEKDHSQYVGLSFEPASAFTSSVETGGFVGRILAGYLTDLVIRRNISSTSKEGSPSKSVLRMYVALMFVVGSVISLHLFRFAVSESSSTAWIMFVGASMGMSYYGPISIFGIISSESVPSHLSGSSYAILSLFGNIGATMSGLPMNYIAKYYEWSTVFFMLEITIGGTLLILARNRNLMPKIGKLKEK